MQLTALRVVLGDTELHLLLRRGVVGAHRQAGVGGGSRVEVCVVGGQVLGEVDGVGARVDEGLGGGIRVGQCGLHEGHGGHHARCRCH